MPDHAMEAAAIAEAQDVPEEAAGAAPAESPAVIVKTSPDPFPGAGEPDAAVLAAAEVAVEASVTAEAGAPDAAVAAAGESAADAATPHVPAVASEPELVEVWRPGGRSEERRGQRRPPRRQHARPAQGAPVVPAQGPTAEGAVAADRNVEATVEAGAQIEKPAAQHRRRRRGPPGEFRRDGGDGGERRQGEQRSEYRPEHRSERQDDRSERPRGERPHFAKDRNEHKDRRDYAPRREREKQPDPDSPFAKLAALKAQLEANAKERR
jgi:ATP-dependent RNA helicase SUPV3L1/SUV3